MVCRAWLSVAILVLVSCGRQTPAADEAPKLTGAAVPVAPIPEAPGIGDLDAIAKRGYLRVLIVPGRPQYAVAGGGVQRGLAVDRAVAFQVYLHSKGHQALQVVFVPTAENLLVEQLVAGRGDIAANLKFTFERDDQVAFSTPIRKDVRELIVTGPATRPLVSLEDVGGRAIHVRKSSDHHASLVRLNQQLRSIDRPGCTIVLADEALTDENLAEQVDAGTIPATLLDDELFGRLRRRLGQITANEDVAVSQGGIVAWALRKDAPALLALMNEFFRSLE